jgi:hypothetical protein
MSGTQRQGTGVSADFVQNFSWLVDGILSGQIIAQTIPAMSVKTVSLSVIRNNLLETIPDQTLTITAAPGVGLVRCDMVQWDGTTINVKNGTAAAFGSVNPPSPDAGFIPLALTMVFNGDTTVRNMGELDSLSTSKGRIYAYYFARRGIYAASQAGQNTTTSGDDPEVFLPLYHPRTGLIKFKGNGSAICNGASPSLGGLTGILKLDGTLITRSTVKQEFNNNSGADGVSTDQDALVTAMPRAAVASGIHRWVVNWSFRAAGQTLTYRLMELEEIL